MKFEGYAEDLLPNIQMLHYHNLPTEEKQKEKFKGEISYVKEIYTEKIVKI